MQSIPCRRVSAGWTQTAAALALLLLLLCLPLVVLALGLERRGDAGVLVAAGAWVVVIASAWFAIARKWRRAGYVVELVDGAIRIRPADSRWRRLQPARVVTAGSVEDGYLETPSCVVLRLGSGTVIRAELACDRGREVLDHLRVGLDHRTLVVPLSGEFDRSAWALATLGGVWAAGYSLARPLRIVPAAAAVVLPACVAGACALLVNAKLKRRLVIGLDGVRVVGVLRSQFIAYANIRRVSRVGRTRGRLAMETIWGAMEFSFIDRTDEAVNALASRIEEGRAAAAAAQASPPLELLDRRGRPFGDWRAALRGLALAERGFRGAALCEDDLYDVVRDPEAPLERRVGAALALRSRDAESSARIRIAAVTSAEPRARAALEAAAADQLDERAIEAELVEAERVR